MLSDDAPRLSEKIKPSGKYYQGQERKQKEKPRTCNLFKLKIKRTRTTNTWKTGHNLPEANSVVRVPAPSHDHSLHDLFWEFHVVSSL